MSDKKIVLKPCPFCKGIEKKDILERTILYSINHKSDCFFTQKPALTAFWDSEISRIERWNKRDFN